MKDVTVSGLWPVGTHLYLSMSEVLSLVKNAEAITHNKRKLSGLNHVVVSRKDDGIYLIQLAGYNGNTGMYGFLVNPDGSLERYM